MRRLGRLRRLALAAATFAACARPHPADVGALVAKDGLDGAAAELRFRVASDPHDRDALAALGAIDARRGRPGTALEALERAAKLGGPPGGKLPAEDRARLASLYLARARERAGRGAPAATADLDRARSLGGDVPDGLARDAAIAAALADAHSSDPTRRARGIAALVAPLPDQPSAAELDRMGSQGAWLWDRGAKRAALAVLDAWVAHGGLAIVGPSSGARIAERWLDARAWWGSDDEVPDGALARAYELGASTCAVAREPGASCSLDDALEAPSPDGPPWEPILWRRAELRGWHSGDPAWLALAARAWLRGDAPSYEAAVRAHLAGADVQALPSWAAPTILRLDGADADRYREALDKAVREQLGFGRGERMVIAVELARSGRPPAEIESALGDDHDPLGDELLARTRPAAAAPPDLAHAAAARALRGHADPRATLDDLAAIAAAYLRDPAIADRAADDWIARDVDVAARAPIAAALFTALGDPARARVLWQRAADASPGEVRVMRGLALAAADVDDPDAALVFVTGAAAASGDPAATLTEVARALAARGRYDHALEAIHLAIQLVPQGDAARLLDLAIAWSRAEGKDTRELALARDALPATPTPAAAAPPPTTDLATLAALAADPRVPDDDAAAAWSAFTAALARKP